MNLLQKLLSSTLLKKELTKSYSDVSSPFFSDLKIVLNSQSLFQHTYFFKYRTIQNKVKIKYNIITEKMSLVNDSIVGAT